MSTRKISKSRYVKGLQCPKLLWLAVNESDSEELKPDLLAQHRFDTGHRIGQLAQERFPEGVLVEDINNLDNWINATKSAITEKKKAIFEAAFSDGSAFVAVDILEYDSGKWNIIEVKSATSVKDTYIDDLAIQYWLLTKLGLDVGKTEVMHINRECTAPDLTNLFVREDVTERVMDSAQAVEAKVNDLSRMLTNDCPSVETGLHCKSPYNCPFYERCHGTLPEHHVSTLYRVSPERVKELQDAGVEEVHHLVDEIQLSKIQSRQVDAVQADNIVVERGLEQDLHKITFPIAFLDFETIAPAVPIWDGCRPYQPVAVQMSCHLLQSDGSLEHHEWIVNDSKDPRPGIASSILESCSKASTIVAYNAPYEKRCIEDIASHVEPGVKNSLLQLNSKFVDLLPIVRNNVYHPKFLGSFSIKKVLPALIPEQGYDSLDIADGMTASIKLEKFVMGELPQWERTKAALLEYCKLDTLAMTWLLKSLETLAKQN